jgi:heme ABC exporter ATP-binding subunit CcmA
VNPALRLDSVTKRLGGRVALKPTSLTAAGGEAVVITGPNGCGKTTLLRIAAGLYRATAGSVSVLGQDPLREPAVRRRVAYLGHDLGIYDELSAAENLRFFAALFGLERARERASEALEAVGLADRAHDRSGAFSRGMKERLALARLVLHDPDVLLLDEPTTGLDEASVRAFGERIRGWRDSGKTVLFTTHDHGFARESGAREFRLA